MLKGAGGRWEGDGDSEVVPEGPPPGLGTIELISFAGAVGMLFWMTVTLLAQRAPEIFQKVRPERHVFASLAVSLAGYMLAMSGINVPRSTRLAGAMLASAVSVALMYILIFLQQSPYICVGVLTVAAGSALCSRCGLKRETGYPAGLVGASILLLGQVFGTFYLR